MYASFKSFFFIPWVQWTAKALLALVVLVYLIHVIEPSQIIGALQQARWFWVLAALLLLPLNLFLEALVWRQMLRPVTADISFKSVFEGLLCGFSLGVFTPARIGEFAGRAFYISHADRWETTLTVFMQRLIDMAVSVGLGTAMLAIILLNTGWLNSLGWWVLFAVGSGVSLALLLVLIVPQPVHRLLSGWISSASTLQRFRLLKRVDRSTMLVAVGLATVRYAVYITQFVFLAFAFTTDITFGYAYGALMLVYLAKFLAPSLTLMDLGLREGFTVFFFGAAGLSQAAAFNASMLIFLLNIALPAAVGIPYLLRMRLSPRQEASTPAPSADFT